MLSKMPSYSNELIAEVMTLWNCDFPYKEFGIINDEMKQKYIQLILGVKCPCARQCRYLKKHPRTFLEKGKCYIIDYSENVPAKKEMNFENLQVIYSKHTVKDDDIIEEL